MLMWYEKQCNFSFIERTFTGNNFVCQACNVVCIPDVLKDSHAIFVSIKGKNERCFESYDLLIIAL